MRGKCVSIADVESVVAECVKRRTDYIVYQLADRRIHCSSLTNTVTAAVSSWTVARQLRRGGFIVTRSVSFKVARFGLSQPEA
jgi:hypothetical protein